MDRIMSGPRRLLRAYYLLTLGIALIGATDAAARWLGWPRLAAGAAVAALELGGAALLAYADARRQLRERAIVPRLLSAGIAAFAVVVQWQGHLDNGGQPTIQAGFFAGMSGLAYTVWVIESESRRRDRLRGDGDLPDAPPSYELSDWLRHPMVTARARALAKATPGLGTYGSLAAARQQILEEQRNAELTAEVRAYIAATVDPRMGRIVALTYDMEEIATRLRASADYDGLAEVFARRLAAERVAGEKQTGATSAGRPPKPARRQKPEPDLDPEVVVLTAMGRAKVPGTVPTATVTPLRASADSRAEALRAIAAAMPSYASWTRLRAAIDDPGDKVATLNRIAAATRMGKSRISAALREASDELVPYHEAAAASAG